MKEFGGKLDAYFDRMEDEYTRDEEELDEEGDDTPDEPDPYDGLGEREFNLRCDANAADYVARITRGPK
jgi:hypothetical protein